MVLSVAVGPVGAAATATPDTGDAVPAMAAPGDAVYRVNAGGDAYTGPNGTEWSADQYYNGGQTTDAETQYGTTQISDTQSDRLYLTERYWGGDPSPEYSFPVQNGNYTVRLHFAEIWFGSQTDTGDGQRVMSANIEGGATELDAYDIHSQVGADTATVEEYTVEVTDGQLDVDFDASVDNPKISAIEILPADGSSGDDGSGDDGSGSTGEATVTVNEGDSGITGTSTYTTDSFEITNTGDKAIETVSLDLSSTALPDIVFDPAGTAGDEGQKGFTLDTNATSGTVEGTFADPQNGQDDADGYNTLQIDFGSFQPGESVGFSVDIDPTSIKGSGPVQNGEAGPVSGLELAGAGTTVAFADGSSAETNLFSTGTGSAVASQATADGTVAPAPSIGAADVSLDDAALTADHAAATVASADQTITVSGEPGETVRLLRIEGELTLAGVPEHDGTPGYNVEAYEANTAIQVEEYTATVGSDGTAEVPVALTNTSETGGYNYFLAAAEDGEGETGATSNVVVLNYDASANDGSDGSGSTGDVLYRANAGGAIGVDGGTDWSDDAQYLVGGGQTAGSPAPTQIDPSVPDTTPAGIWTTERYDPPGGSEMQYEFDVPAGQRVEVRLYFYDGYSGTSNPGDRVFDVSVESQSVEDFDPIAAFGDQTGGMESFTVTSDGTVDVDFAHIANNPQVNAIEIVEAPATPGELDATSAVDFGDVVVGESETDTVTLTNAGGAGDASISVDDVSVTGADADDFSVDFPGSTTLAPGETTTVDVTFAPSTTMSKEATLEVSHDAPNTASPLAIDLTGAGTSDVPVGFNVTGLGADLFNPTSLDFGPDGRLYASQQDGLIKAFEVERTGTSEYTVTDTEVITTVQNLPNYDDDGTHNPNVENRQVTGLIVEGTASEPVIYVSSSDPRIGAGDDGTDSGLDTNSGVVSRLTQTGSGWDHDMLVRGLPRSEENHATNGLQYDEANNTLYVASGGNTNKGAPSDNFALTPEYALSAAILTIDLDQIDSMAEKDAAHTDASYLYDLPTLQGTDKPFGGQDGENMAMWTQDSPVDVYSPGYRNTYDIAFDSEGQLYATDNGANPGWGGVVVDEGPQGECTNEQNEQDEFSPPGVYYVPGEDFYAGHPNPTRGNSTSEFAGAVESGLHNPVECDYISPNVAPSSGGALETYGPTPQGMDVYTASNFGGAMQGDLLLSMWNTGNVKRVQLTQDGTQVTSSGPIFENIGGNPLDVHAQGDDDTFPGTVWAATYGSNAITVFEPTDYDGAASGTCTADDPDSPTYDPDGDADGDGYTNADENAVGTNPCSQASQPADMDQDGIPNSLDSDDDNDGLSDGEDPFAIDAQNGLDNEIPVERNFEAGQHPQSLFGLGFTGLMTNGTDYADLYNASQVRAGGATERISVDEVPFGDAYGNKNSQRYGFQYGVNATGDAPFTVRGTVESPFSDDMTPENYQSAGIQMGTGDQENYFKLVATAQDGSGGTTGGVQFLKEVDGSPQSQTLAESQVFGSGQTIDFYFDVYPSNDTVRASYAIDGGQRTYFDETFTMPDSWYANDQRGLAVGLISTANGADSTFSASWDRLSVTEIGTNTPPVAEAGADRTVEENTTVMLNAANSTDPNGNDLTYSWTQTAGPTVELTSPNDTAPSFTAPDVDTNTTLVFEVTVTDSAGATSTDSVSIVVQDTDGTTPAPSGDVYRVNAGGEAYTAADGTEWSADDYFTGGSVSDLSSDVDDVANTTNDPLYTTERYGPQTGYAFPVADGTYEVTLHLAEVWHGTDYGNPNGGVGSRVMSANFEGGDAELAGYDIYADVGALTATTMTYTVEVTDGELNAAFGASTDLPKVSAIEVTPVDDGASNQAPSIDAIADRTVTAGNTTEVDVTASDADGDALTLSTVDAPAFVDLADDGDGTGTLTVAPESADAGTYTIEVTASDGTATASETFQLTVEEGTTPTPTDAVYRVNAGGEAYTAADGTEWSADDYFTGGSSTDAESQFGTTQISDTQSDRLYLTERYWGSDAGTEYSFPVEDGNYTVRLHFAEIWFGSQTDTGDGQRVMSANIEGGATELDAYDIHSQVGANTATVEEYTVEVTDGQLDVDFDASVDNPKVSAIEILPADDSSGDDTTTEHTITFAGDGAQSTYELTVSGEVLGGSGLSDPDTYDGATASGEVWSWQDSYTYTGSIESFSLDGNATVTVDGETVDPSTLGSDDGSSDDGANSPPTADAGGDQSVDEGATVTLDATGSSDPDGDALSYDWTQVGGPDVTLDSATAAQPTFTAPDVDADQTLTFEVTATDAAGATDTDEVTVAVSDVEESTSSLVFAVNAGGDAYTASDGTTYQADANFDGGSSGAAGTAGIPESPAIDGTDDDALYHTERYGGSFGYDVPVDDGTYRVTLEFAEIYHGVSSNDAPAGGDGTNAGDRVFSATAEGQTVVSDFDIFDEVGPLTATERTATVEVTDGTLDVDFASSADNAKLSAMTVEAVDSTDDGSSDDGSSGDVTTEHTITFAGDGAQSTYEFTVSGEVLSGSGLASPDTYSGSTASGEVWSWQDSYTYTGSVESFSLDGNATVTVDGETVDPSTLGSSDGSSGDDADSPPTADAGDQQTVAAGETVTLDATGSSDPDGDAISYEWEQLSGPDVTLDSATAAQPTFTAPDVDAETTLTFQVTTTAGGATDTASVAVTVTPDDGSGDDTTTEHTITLSGDGAQSTYEFTVSGEVLGGSGLASPDTYSGSTASGEVWSWQDSYTYTGSIESFSLDGNATVTVDGETVDPSTLG